MVISKTESMWNRSFLKKLTNAFDHIPIWIEIKVHPNSVIFLNRDEDFQYYNEILTYEIDFNKSVELNVFNARKLVIERWSPILMEVEVTKRPPTADELTSAIMKNEPLPVTGVEVVKETKWYMSKVILRTSTIVITTGLSEGIQRIYSLKCPLGILLHKAKTLSPEDFYIFFLEKTIFKREIND